MREELLKLESEYEMPDEIDMSGALMGRFYQPKKIATTIRLDDDIIMQFKKKALEQKVGYQSLINAALREYMTHSKAS
jgi:uncharacterized protein (DUF4415 family)